MESSKEIIIIGGGVIGMACAHYLVRSGARVRIIEKNEIGKGASHGNCGLLCFSDVIPLCSPGAVTHEIARLLKRTSPLYIKPSLDVKLLVWLMKFASKCTAARMNRTAKQKYGILSYSINLFDELMSREGLICDFEKKGLLTVFKDRKNFENYQATSDFLETFNMGAKKIEREEALAMEPALSEDIAGAWFNKIDWHLRPDMLMTSWRKYLVQQGVIIEEHCGLLEFEMHGRTVKAVKTVTGRFVADAFVLATGAWANTTLKQLKLDLPVQPGKGYSITMERPGRCPSQPCSLYEKNMVVTPWKSGYRMGGTMEFSGVNDYLEPRRLSNLIFGATAYLKDPTGHPVLEQWTGLRPMTCDDLPIIDWAPGQENLIVATGHGMLGLTLATGTGKIVNDMIYGKTPDINITPFGMGRFQ